MTGGKQRHGVKHYVLRSSHSEVSPSIVITLGDTRERAALDSLLKAGATGCSFYDDPAPRWAASIYRLRKRGLDIITVREPHAGKFPGTHAKYILASLVKPLSGSEERKA